MQTSPKSIKSAKDLKCCVIIPTYNNDATLKSVIADVSQYIGDVIVVNDGSTDTTDEILSQLEGISVISYKPNRGKGYALKQGFKSASGKGYSYAITIDSDGQHSASDINLFLTTIKEFPESMLIGQRNLHQTNMPGGNTFANKFSNFWYKLQTGINLPDTQSGFRLYPLKKLYKVHFLTTRYELELEILIRLAWRGVNIISLPINVYYPPSDERVSHFRPFWDFFRISLLNTYFTLLSFVYYHPKKLILNISRIGSNK